MDSHVRRSVAAPDRFSGRARPAFLYVMYAILLGVFPSLGENKREALKIAAGFRGEEAFDAGVAEEQALETVLPRLSRARAHELAQECLELYLWDRLGCDN